VTSFEASWRPNFNVFEAVAEELSDTLDQMFPSSLVPLRVEAHGHEVDIAPALRRHFYTVLVNDRRILDGVRRATPHERRSVIRGNIERALAGEIPPKAYEGLGTGGRAKSARRATTDVLFVTGNARLSRFVVGVAGGIADEGATVHVVEDPRQAMKFGWRASRVIGSRAMGDTAASEISSLVEATLALLEASAPRVVGIVEGCKPVDAVVVECCRQLDVPTVCLQQGWSPIVHAGFRGLRASTMATWGVGFSDLVRAVNPQLDCTVIGSEVVMEGMQIACKRTTSAMCGWPRAIGFALGGANLYFDDHLLLELASEVARAFPATDVVLRPHPAQAADAAALLLGVRSRNVSVVPPDEQRLAEFIGGSDVLVAGMSTTLLEARAVGVPVVAAGVSGLEHIAPFDLAVGQTCVDSAQGLVDLLLGIREDDSVIVCDDHLREHYFSCSMNPDPRRSAISTFLRYVG
jgi:hypothetical protein